MVTAVHQLPAFLLPSQHSPFKTGNPGISHFDQFFRSNMAHMIPHAVNNNFSVFILRKDVFIISGFYQSVSDHTDSG
jgi:hypothetical protein